jgi:signal transduction histidine kinase
MNPDSRLSKLITEEVKATKLYLWLFYIIFIAYDIFYYFLLPQFSSGGEIGLPKEGLGYWFHILVIAFLPFAIYFLKSSKPYIVKYIYFFGYNLLDIINTLMIYLGTDLEFASGNLVELFLILFSPIFINKKYYWMITWTIILKYLFYGIVLQDPKAVLGIVILGVLAGVSYLLLSRFYSYLKTLEIINEEIRAKEKMALVGQLATSIGHEIRNPLAALKGFTQLQHEKYPNDKGFYQIMENEIERINLIVNDLMYLGKPKTFVATKHDVKEIIHYVVTMLNPIAQSNNVQLNVNIDGLPKIDCDSNQLKQVFINLLKNAIESMPTGGKIDISSAIKQNKQIEIVIEDEGQGIEKEKLEKLGQPFYTTKQDGNGLGLMVTYNIIEQHKGQIIYSSEIGKGTKVTICLPINNID